MKEIEITLADLLQMQDSIEEDQDQDQISVWVKDKDIYVPSTDISIMKELPPGMYKVEYSNDRGFYTKEISLETDELFTFTDSVTEDLLNQIKIFWEKEDLYKEKKLVHKRGILLAGYAGTGKTTIINMASKELIASGGVVFKIYGIKSLSNYMDFMKHGFRKIQPDTPVITILEDIDQYSDVEVELLDFLDGQYHVNHHIVIATSNNTEEIPDTFLRPSRLDLKIEVSHPSEMTRREYFENKGVPSEDLEKLVKETEECSLADLKEVYICIYLLDYSVEDAINQVMNPTAKKNYLVSKFQKSKIGL